MRIVTCPHHWSRVDGHHVAHTCVYDAGHDGAHRCDCGAEARQTTRQGQLSV